MTIKVMTAVSAMVAFAAITSSISCATSRPAAQVEQPKKELHAAEPPAPKPAPTPPTAAPTPASTEITPPCVMKELPADYHRRAFAHFEFNSAVLDQASGAELLSLLDWAKSGSDCPAKGTITLIGYTDSIGSDEYNMRLSARRAASAEEMLLANIHKKRAKFNFVLKHYGKQHPVADNATDEGRAQNRRVEMIVALGKGCAK